MNLVYYSMDRASELSKWRPHIKIAHKDDASEIEAFMHHTLRPVLKFQNEVILLLIESTPHFSTIKWLDEPELENRALLNAFIQRSSNLKNQLLGVIIGLFKKHEIEFYLGHEKELRKRIIEMCVTRYHSQKL